MRQLDIERIGGTTAAWCADCGGLRSDATRQRAINHARHHGHTVRFAVQQITAYRPSDRSKS